MGFAVVKRHRIKIETMHINIKPATLLLSSFLILFISHQQACAAANDVITQGRANLKNYLEQIDLGKSYAHILNFFTEPDISASTYSVDDAANTQIDLYKLPLQRNFALNNQGLEIGLRGILSYATLEMDHAITETASVDSRWKSYSGTIGTALQAPLGKNFTFFSALDVGVSEFDNRGRYNGANSSIYGYIFDGIIYNWDTYAWLGSFSTGLDFSHQMDTAYTLDIKGRYTFTHVASFSESNDFQSFDGTAQTASIMANVEHPLGFSMREMPFFGVAHLGYTFFIGPNRDTLGFDSYGELGYSVKVDITHLDSFIDHLRFGYQYSLGDNVTGHTVLFSLDFDVF